MKITSSFLLRKVPFLSAIFFLVVLFSCKKDGKVVPDFDSGNLNVQYVDTFSVISSLDTVAPLVTDASIYHLLGLYNDPIFGPVSSTIYSQVLLTGVNVDFGNTISNPTYIDSVVLSLSYSGLYGDTAASMTVEVYELASPMDANTVYYSNDTIPCQAILLGTKTFVPNTSVDLRIKLANSYGNAILTNAPYADNTAFTSFFNGLCIRVQDNVSNTTIPQGSGSIAYLNLNSTSSKVSLYYHQNDISKAVQQYDFNIAEAKKFSHFEHNYTGTDIEAHLNAMPTRDTNLTYVSTMAGVTTILSIPNIKDLAKEGAVIINKAQLILTVEAGTEGSFEDALKSITLFGRDASGNSFQLPDLTIEGFEYFGGSLNETARTYTFNIANHIHDLIHSTSIDYGMYLLANGSSTSSNRVVLGSEKNVISKIQLNITYSKL